MKFSIPIFNQLAVNNLIVCQVVCCYGLFNLNNAEISSSP